MPAFARNLLLAASVVLSSAPALAGGTQGVYLPTAPQGTGGEDVVETASGARCRQSMNSNGTYLDVGVTASTSTPSNRRSDSNAGLLGYFGGNNNYGTEALGYARVIVPLGQRPARLDCSRMYELEIARMKREIELLKLAAE